MAKEAFYFTHDYGSRNDPKLQKVLMKIGHEGKSVYWDLVEMLYEEGGYLELSECENYAFALRTNHECITKLVNDFDLFKKDDKKFWSESILRRLEQRYLKSQKASDSAKSRWDKANALKNHANASKNDAIKESKGKEIKEYKDNVELTTPTTTTSSDSKTIKELPITERAKKFVEKFNSIRSEKINQPSKYRLTKDVEVAFRQRIKDYEAKDILKAVENAFNHQWQIKNNFEYLTPEYILRIKQLEKYRNMTPSQLKSENELVH
jgi:hypothetical protein